jgi:acetyltransferase-like isoleucine patch superfamily enzyme
MADQAPLVAELEAIDVHRRAGRLSEAKRLLRKLLVRYPLQPATLHLLGLVLHQSAQNEDAVELLRLSVELEPRSVAFHNNLGAVLADMGRNGEAIAVFRKALELDPGSARAQADMAAAINALTSSNSRSAAASGRLIRMGTNIVICCGPPERIRLGENVSLPSAAEAPALINTFAGRVEMGDWCLIGYGLQIHTGTHDPDTIEAARHVGLNEGRDVILGRGVWTGARVTILGPARIGDHAVIGACSLVRGDIPAGEMWAGNPARFIRALKMTQAMDPKFS